MFAVFNYSEWIHVDLCSQLMLASPCGPVQCSNLTCLKGNKLFAVVQHYTCTIQFLIFFFLFSRLLVYINLSIIWTPYINWFFGVLLESKNVSIFWKDI